MAKFGSAVVDKASASGKGADMGVAAGSDGNTSRRSGRLSSTRPRIVELRSATEMDAAAELLFEVWGARRAAERNEVISVSFLRTLAHTHSYVAGAYRDDRLVGCAVGFFGADGEQPNHLHSHILGVAPWAQNTGVGFALKGHQREWALRHDIATIRWTFDPLVCRNAHFNICKLGADISDYEENFYGRLDDGTNTGDETDRLLVEWKLRSDKVEQAMAGVHVPPAVTGTSGKVKTIPIPDNIAKVRENDPAEAREWRLSVRKRFREMLGQGYRVVGLALVDGHREYVLAPGDEASTSAVG